LIAGGRAATILADLIVLGTRMRSFIIAVVVAIVLAIGFAAALNFFQKTADEEFQTQGVRL
jgi:hypothetical protein